MLGFATHDLRFTMDGYHGTCGVWIITLIPIHLFIIPRIFLMIIIGGDLFR